MSAIVQIRNVPDEIHPALKPRAALAGMSLSDSLPQELRHTFERPTLEQVKARLAQREPVNPRPGAAAAVRAERMSR
jgi:antitoxin FitA